MKCPNCGHDMVQSRAGMMCLSCGYLVKTPDSGNTTEVPSITIGHDSRGKLGSPAPTSPDGDNKPDGDDKKNEDDKAEPSPETAAESTSTESSEDAKPPVEQVVAEAVKEIGGSTATDASEEAGKDSGDTGSAKPVIVKVTSADTKPETPEEPETPAEPSTEEPAAKEDDKPEVKPEASDPKPDAPEEPTADEPSADEPAKVDPVTPDVPAAPAEALEALKAVEDEEKAESEEETADAAKLGSLPDSPEPVTAAEPETPAAPDETAPEKHPDSGALTPPESLESVEAEEKVETKADTDADTETDGEPADSDTTTPSPEQSAPVGPDAATSPAQPQPEPPVGDPAEPQDAPTPAPQPAPAPQPPVDSANPPAPTPDQTPAPTPDQAPAQAPAPDAKAPLQPATHPHPKSNMIAVVAAAAVLIIGAGVTFAVMSHKSGSNSGGTVKAAETGPTQSTPTPTPSTDAQMAQPTADPAAADNQRKADLAAYLAAYKAQAVGGYFPVTPPAVSVSATDPGTGQPYIVSKDKPGAAGQIQYWPGGVCTGTPHTPGATGTHYLALVTMLADGVTTYCLDSTHN